MIDRDSLRLSRLFKIHRRDTTDQVHSISGQSVYASVNDVKAVAQNYMSPDSISLRIIPDVTLGYSVIKGSLLGFEESMWVDDASHLLVNAISIDGSEANYDTSITIDSTSVNTSGITRLALVTDESNLVESTPANLKFLMNKLIATGVVVESNINTSRWWIDDDSSNKFCNGTFIRGLSNGIHTIHFDDVPGYITPDPQTVDMSDNGYKSICGVYVPNQYKLTCIMNEPDDKWSIDGINWYASGQTITGLNPGSYVIRFSTVSETNVSNQTIVVTDKDLKIQVFYD